MFRAIPENRAIYFVLLGLGEEAIIYIHFMKLCSDAESKVTSGHCVE